MDRYNKTRAVPVASIIALFTLLLLTPLAFAESNAIPTMARIVSELNHFPSDEQKETLAAISKEEDNSKATRAIADAIRNIEHKARPEDVAALKKITGDASASEAEKQLATIVMDFNHKAGSEAQKTLKALAQQ